MFDGNHRVRRQVNLSSGRRRTTGATGTGTTTSSSTTSASNNGSKASVLEISRQRRAERLLQQRKRLAAVCIQTAYRRHVALSSFLLFLEQRLESLLLMVVPSSSSSSITGGSETVVRDATVTLNLRLGRSVSDATTVEQWLQQLGVTLRHRRSSSSSSSSVPITTTPLHPAAPACSQRVIAASLQLLKRTLTTAGCNDDTGTLQAAETCETLLGYLLVAPALLQSAHQWRTASGSILSPSTVQTIVQVTAALMTQQQQQQVQQQQSTVWNRIESCTSAWLVQAAPATTTAHAILAVLALLQNTKTQKVNPVWLNALVTTLQQSQQETTTLPDASTGSSVLLVQTVKDLVQAHAGRILTRAVATDSVSAISTMSLLQHALQSNTYTRRALADSLATGRNPVSSSSNASSKTSAASTSGSYDDDEEDMELDDDDDEEMARESSAASTTFKKARTTTGRLTKRDLLTVPKLDRLYQQQVRQQQQIAVSSAATTDVSLELTVTSFGRADLWLQWGRLVFAGTGTKEARGTYCTLLAVLLQEYTGLRPRQSATHTLLTKLAFAPDLLEHLWQHCLEMMQQDAARMENAAAAKKEGRSPATYACVSVFCDLFAHQLIALKDDQFLANHTMQVAFSTKRPIILAQDVIERLRDFLYELYWTKPARVDWVRLPFDNHLDPTEHLQATQARLMLTGTKLWNSLYERWCRLVRHSPFCDESTWLFPHMASLTGENAVTNQAGGNVVNIGDDQSVESMDVDSDDDEVGGAANGVAGAVSTAEAENDALADVFSDPKMARVLTCIPQALPFGRRVKLFDSLLKADKAKTQDESSAMHEVMMNMMRGQEGASSFRERVEIRRDKLYDDSMRQLNQLGPKLKKKVQVTFVSRHGTQEAGIDGGGVFKEFIDDLIKDAFQPDADSHQQLFSVTPLQTLSVSTTVSQDPSMLTHYEFLGRVLGKAVYESILVEPQFCLPFLNQLLGKNNSLEDLKNFDTEYYNNVTKLLVLPSDQLEMAGLTFELTLGTGAASRTVELVPGGRNKAVTKENVIHYVHMVAHQRLNVEGSMQTRAFLHGFRDLIPAAWVRLFSAYELQKLISGDDSVKGMDVPALRQAMQYAGGYHPSQPAIEWFWQVVQEFTADQQCMFLKFMTSCSRPPLLGFGSLEPAPCLQQIRLPDAMFLEQETTFKQAPLPTASTCMNLLKLPNYRSKELLKQKLVAAIEAGAGFELS